MDRQISLCGDNASRSVATHAVTTIAALLLAFAAFDDITTDEATSFPLEYTALVASAAWLLFVTVRLFRDHQRLLGVVSLLALASAVWGQRAVGPGVVWDGCAGACQPEFVAVITAYGWFLTLSLGMLGRAWHERSRRVRQSA